MIRRSFTITWIELNSPPQIAAQTMMKAADLVLSILTNMSSPAIQIVIAAAPKGKSSEIRRLRF